MSGKSSGATAMDSGMPGFARCSLRSLRMWGATVLFAWTVVCWLALDPTSAVAKKKLAPTKTVTGTVVDQSDNPIAGASVELTDTTTDKKLAIYSEADGGYKFSGLRPTDDYEVRATYKGASSRVRKASSLDDRETIVLNLKIPPSSSQ